MKVIHIITDTNFGGAGRYLTYLLSQPAFADIDVVVACPDGELGKRIDAMDIRRIAISGRDVSFNSRLTRELFALLRREKPDLVHTHSSLSGRIAARLGRIPVVYTKHGEAGQDRMTSAPGLEGAARSGGGGVVLPGAWEAGRSSAGRTEWAGTGGITRRRVRAGNPVKRLFNRVVANALSDKIIAVSERVRDGLVLSGIDPSMVVTIHNGIDLGLYESKENWDNPVSEGISVITPQAARRGFLVGTLARLSSEKGLDVFVDAAKLVLSSEPAARFVIGGTGPVEDELRSRIRDLRLEPYVRMPGFVENVPEFLSKLDVFVLPSDSEGIGLAVMEAMAASLPVAATEVGGVPEVVVDGQTGILVPPRQSTLLAQAIVRLLVDPGLARTMGLAGRARVRELFDAKVMAEKTVAIYGDLVSDAP